ncbi:TIGR04255 family protein [Dictyobacter vulcani]|uniref:TIGR04255 family protein n=1 Tax=Dictyobacter vulcani TaxID=2607529 RepID=A0A5J4KFU4_9CHLR|nr:TIGR04255 family protein [Dictyobacter vulcani]GER86533.1 TIGR04255 family protein [Dictyobacter vulcani]
MQEQRHYPNAPITEAIIDFRVTLPEDFSFDRLLAIQDEIQELFPTSEILQANTFLIEPGSTMSVNAQSQKNGLAFTGKDQRKKVQVTLSGFTFSHLAPYSSWNNFHKEAKLLWQIYKNICQPINVTRAAVRFVNQINIPVLEKVELNDYLRTVPDVSTDLTQGMLSSFFMQLQIPQTDLNCILIINEALAPQVTPGFMSIILDIDLYREQLWQSNDESIWTFLEKLHLRKNQVFEASITDKTRRLFE